MLNDMTEGSEIEWSAFQIIGWLMSAALMTSLVRCDAPIRKSERMTEAGRRGRGCRPRRRKFLRLEKVSEGKNGYVKLARKQFPRQTRVPVVHSASHVKHRDDKYEKSMCDGGMPDQMIPLERGTNQGFR